MRLSESLSNLIKNDVKITSESSENEAKYISELRDAVLKKAESENFSPDLDQLEAESTSTSYKKRDIKIC